MTEYLHKYAKNDSIEGKGVTYVLVAEDRKRIYAYATIKAYSLYYYDDAEKYFGRKADKNRKIYNGMLKTYFYSFMGPKPPKKG